MTIADIGGVTDEGRAPARSAHGVSARAQGPSGKAAQLRRALAEALAEGRDADRATASMDRGEGLARQRRGEERRQPAGEVAGSVGRGPRSAGNGAAEMPPFDYVAWADELDRLIRSTPVPYEPSTADEPPARGQGQSGDEAHAKAVARAARRMRRAQRRADLGHGLVLAGGGLLMSGIIAVAVVLFTSDSARRWSHAASGWAAQALFQAQERR